MQIVSAEEAVAGIRSGQQVWVHGGAATPSVLLDALVARAPELEDVRMVHFHTEGPGPHLAPEMEGHLRHKALFIGRNARQAVNEGRADYVPVFLSDVPNLFTSGILPLDVALLNLTRPDEHGFCSLGTSVGATLQLGIGAIPAAPALALRDKRDLGVHTEMFTNAVMDLVECGAITGAAKEINRFKIVSAFLMGDRRLYDFVDDNPMIELRPVDYTNDTAVIRRFRRMVAINSAIRIDVTGQGVAESIGKRMFSGVGGQMDFIRGAALAPEGRAIIALPATAAGGTISRIVPVLDEGAGVVTTRAHVWTVVTEFGVAELHGRSIAERARALIGIGHPDFRDELSARAHRA